jgi:hypothetical protein
MWQLQPSLPHVFFRKSNKSNWLQFRKSHVATWQHIEPLWLRTVCGKHRRHCRHLSFYHSLFFHLFASIVTRVWWAHYPPHSDVLDKYDPVPGLLHERRTP